MRSVQVRSDWAYVVVSYRRMPDIFGIIAAIERLFYREPERPYLATYLELKVHKMQDHRAVGAVIAALGFATIGFMAFIGIGLLTRNWRLAWMALAIGGGASIATIIWYWLFSRREHLKLTHLEIQAKPLITELYQASVRRRLEKSLGPGIPELLDEGARHWLECKQVFDSVAWVGASPDSMWSTAKSRALAAMESAMLRLIIASKQASIVGAHYVSPALDPAIRLVEEMREMSNQAKRLSDKLIVQGGASSTDAVSDLQEALSEMRRLESAQDELNQWGQA